MSFTAIITADARSFEQAIERAQKQIDGLEKSVGRNLDSISKKFTDIGEKMTVVSAGIIAGLGASVKASIDFESAFAGVLKTVDGTTEQLDNLKQGIIDMSKEIPASTTEIAKVAEAAGQLGIETDRVLEFTRTMIDLGESTNLSSEQASTALARFANIVQMSQKDFDRLGSTVVALGNNFATTEAEITEMALRLAGVGKQVGLSEAEILALSTALSSVGIEAQAGGSAFSRLLSNIQLAVETGGEDLRNFAAVAGMSAEQFANAFRDDAVNALNLFIQGLSDTSGSGQSAIAILDEMGITEIRLRDAILRASGASDLFTDAVKLGNQAWEENIALTEETAKRYETTASQIAILKNNLADVGRVIGDILLPTVKSMVARLKDMLNAISNLNPVIVKIGVAIAGITAALGPAMLALGQLLKILPLIGSAFTAMTGPIGIAVAAIAGATTLIVSNWDAIKEYFTSGDGAKVFETIKSMAVAVKNDIIAAFNAIKTAVKTIWNAIGDDIIKIFGNALKIVMAALEMFVNTFKNVAKILHGIFTLDFRQALDGLKTLFNDIFEGIKKIVFNAVSAISSALAGVFDFIGLDKWAEGLRSFSDKLSPSIEKVKEETEQVTEATEEQIEVVNELAGTTGELTATIGGLVEAQEQLIKDGSDVNELIRRTSDEITVLTKRLEGLRSGEIVVRNVYAEIEKTEKKVKDLSSALDLLTGGRELTIDLNIKSGAAAFRETDLFKGYQELLDESGQFIITPEIDTSLVEAGMGRLVDETKVLSMNIGNMIGYSISDMMRSIGVALAEGENIIDVIGKSLLATIGDLAVKVGEQMIAFGTAGLALKRLIHNPIAAIAAGSALVALGSAAASAISKTIDSHTGGGGYVGGASSYQQVAPAYAPSEYRGAYREDYTVEFKIGTNELVGVLDMAEQKKKRL